MDVRSEGKGLQGGRNQSHAFSLEEREDWNRSAFGESLLGQNLFSSIRAQSTGHNIPRDLSQGQRNSVGSGISLLQAIAVDPQQFLSSHFASGTGKVESSFLHPYGLHDHEACRSQQVTPLTRNLSEAAPSSCAEVLLSTSGRESCSLSQEYLMRVIGEDEMRDEYGAEFSECDSMTHQIHVDTTTRRILQTTIELALQFCEQINAVQSHEATITQNPIFTSRSALQVTQPYGNPQIDGPIGLHNGSRNRLMCTRESRKFISEIQSDDKSQKKQ